MNNNKFLEAWFRLECVGFDKGSRLVSVDGDTCDDVELVAVCFLPEDGKYRVYMSAALPDEVSNCIMGLDPQALFGNSQLVEDVLYVRAGMPKVEIRKEITYRFDNAASGQNTNDVAFLGDTEETLDTFHIVRNGDWVSRAWSVRRNWQAAEIAVETKENYRRMGFGKQVVAAWVKYQLSLGKEAIYSHRTGNLESMYLAQSVGAINFVEITSYY